MNPTVQLHPGDHQVTALFALMQYLPARNRALDRAEMLSRATTHLSHTVHRALQCIHPRVKPPDQILPDNAHHLINLSSSPFRASHALQLPHYPCTLGTSSGTAIYRYQPQAGWSNNKAGPHHAEGSKNIQPKHHRWVTASRQPSSRSTVSQFILGYLSIVLAIIQVASSTFVAMDHIAHLEQKMRNASSSSRDLIKNTLKQVLHHQRHDQSPSI